jgi:hypothetical protein
VILTGNVGWGGNVVGIDLTGNVVNGYIQYIPSQYGDFNWKRGVVCGGRYKYYSAKYGR